MGKNKFQCPQCGAASSAKISETVYNCIYCDSNFDVEPSGSNVYGKNANARQELVDKMAQLRSQMTPEAVAAARKKGLIVMAAVVSLMFMIGGIVAYSVNSKFKNVMATTNAAVENASVNKFCVFSGSKGPVVWMLMEQEGSMTDSVHYQLRIIDPRNNVVLKEVEFIPAMTWSDNFNASKFIGSLYAFGDTCWIISDHDILYARDVYSGKIIATANQLGKQYLELAQGITKAEWPYINRVFNITTNDGFDFVFAPNAKKVFKKEEWDKRDDKNLVTRNFFVLTDNKRPALFKTVEKRSPFATSSNTFSSALEEYDPAKNKRPWGLNSNTISITPLLSDKTFFNGFVEYSDNDKAIIMYQSSAAKTSEVHICCVNADGKELWDISGKEIEVFAKIFSDNNRGVTFTFSPSAAIFYEEYGDHQAMGLDWQTGKVLWSFPVTITAK